MRDYRFAECFERKVLQERPHAREGSCVAVVERPTRSEPQGDSPCIDHSDEPSVESREISEGVVLDCNAAGRLVGVDIDEASKAGGRQISLNPHESRAHC